MLPLQLQNIAHHENCLKGLLRPGEQVDKQVPGYEKSK